MALPISSVEQMKLQREDLYIKLRLVCHTTDASIKGFCLNSPDVEVNTETDGQTIAAKLGFAVSDLDDDASGGAIGVHINCTDAAEVVEVALCKDSVAASQVLVSGSTPGDLTAIVPVLFGASSTGITTTSGVAFTLGLTGVDQDSAIGTIDFWIHVVYAKSQPRF